ncbi:ras-related protein Rab-39A-like [Callorhinchus milii]|uniref:ras-related protein Rab-39A-like n=1 Tax=Callorhinchus milii TaxID=7868 RepID=UPI0004575028|nr:ras-related protein Rab-39A-like [Callorhinchus milii]|eukprot:gi/632954584/ref/XP_007893040.1/ PREDICTED: ras-related protein Rab-39A-like [Callorhinchus milii]
MGQSGSRESADLRHRLRRGSLKKFIWQFRVVLVGDSAVGKTSIVLRLTEGTFCEILQKTIGVDYYIYILEAMPTVRVKLQVWDTAGEKEYRTITQSHLQTMLGGLLVFDLTRRRTLDYIRNWLNEASEALELSHRNFILVGNKSDLSAERQVPREEAELAAAEMGLRYAETSAKEDENIQDVFLILASSIAEVTEVKGGIRGLPEMIRPVFFTQ